MNEQLNFMEKQLKIATEKRDSLKSSMKNYAKNTNTLKASEMTDQMLDSISIILISYDPFPNNFPFLSVPNVILTSTDVEHVEISF